MKLSVCPSCPCRTYLEHEEQTLTIKYIFLFPCDAGQLVLSLISSLLAYLRRLMSGSRPAARPPSARKELGSGMSAGPGTNTDRNGLWPLPESIVTPTPSVRRLFGTIRVN